MITKFVRGVDILKLTLLTLVTGKAVYMYIVAVLRISEN